MISLVIAVKTKDTKKIREVVPKRLLRDTAAHRKQHGKNEVIMKFSIEGPFF